MKGGTMGRLVFILAALICGFVPGLLAVLLIPDSSLAAVTSHSVTLTWIAPGDDGVVGRVHSYDIRIKKVMSVGYTQLLASPVPRMAGLPDSTTIDGLDADQEYDVIVSACDEVRNCSPFSMSYRFRTLSAAARDTTPPGTVTVGQ